MSCAGHTDRSVSSSLRPVVRSHRQPEHHRQPPYERTNLLFLVIIILRRFLLQDIWNANSFCVEMSMTMLRLYSASSVDLAPLCVEYATTVRTGLFCVANQPPCYQSCISVYLKLFYRLCRQCSLLCINGFNNELDKNIRRPTSPELRATNKFSSLRITVIKLVISVCCNRRCTMKYFTLKYLKISWNFWNISRRILLIFHETFNFHYSVT